MPSRLDLLLGRRTSLFVLPLIIKTSILSSILDPVHNQRHSAVHSFISITLRLSLLILALESPSRLTFHILSIICASVSHYTIPHNSTIPHTRNRTQALQEHQKVCILLRSGGLVFVFPFKVSGLFYSLILQKKRISKNEKIIVYNYIWNNFGRRM